MFDRRAAVVASTSLVVFLVCLLVGISISGIGRGGSDAIDITQGTNTTQLTIPNSPDDTQWKIIPEASMDFGGSRVDTSVWDLYEGRGNAGVGKREPRNLSVTDGQLQIKAEGLATGGLSQKFGQTYGRWVVRARMEPGKGYGPALLLWPDSEKWPEDGEIDFAEMPSADRSGVVMTTHWGKDNSQHSFNAKGDFTQWHTYTVDWLPDRIVYYIDGVEQGRQTTPAESIPNKPMHLAMQTDTGSCNSWLGCPDEANPGSASLYVSSVRVYAPEGL